MPQDAPPNGSARDWAPAGSGSRVAEMQTKLHRWAAADPGRRFDDLFNFVHDPATLIVAFSRVAGNRGANTPGIVGVTAAEIEEAMGVPGFLDDLRVQLKAGTFTPLPVRERTIPKPGGSGKVRKLGIPTIADRVVQAALKLVLEPIFEADFCPSPMDSGRCGGRTTRSLRSSVSAPRVTGWVLDADIEACFDTISHPALMDRVRARVKDKRVLALVKAFLKAGVLTETGYREDSFTGTPQGGILSPLLANIALSALDEHVHGPWLTGGVMSTPRRRARRRIKGLPNWRVVRYADDFVILVHGTRDNVQALREEIALDFLGFRIQWRRKRGTSKWYVYTFIADRPVQSVKQKVRALTRRTSQQPPRDVLIRLNQIMRGWANYFRHAVCKHTLGSLENFVWHRVIRWWMRLRRWKWKDVRRHLTGRNGRWTRPTADGIELFNMASVSVIRYRYRGSKIPNPWTVLNHA